jgi:hypothetical protein
MPTLSLSGIPSMAERIRTEHSLYVSFSNGNILSFFHFLFYLPSSPMVDQEKDTPLCFLFQLYQQIIPRDVSKGRSLDDDLGNDIRIIGFIIPLKTIELLYDHSDRHDVAVANIKSSLSEWDSRSTKVERDIMSHC